MITEKENKRISKFLSYVLRHHPELIGIELDENGWADVKLVIEQSNIFGVQFDREILDFIVATNNKKRFAYDETLTKMRASQGHSINITLGYTAQEPPTLLYHGTASKYVDAILQHGILKQSRQHVHLSKDFETAVQVGQRHGKPHVFTVLSAEMFKDNFQFYQSENGVWLTDVVPNSYLKI